MKREKSNILSRSPESIIFMLLIGLVSVLLNFTFSHNSFAEYKATLSASVNETTASIDGTEIIESSDETAEHEINLKINTTNKTGYTATFSSKTDETALLNTNPAINTKINSISSNSSLTNFPANTWGYRFDDDAVFSPIPAQSASANLIKTTEKTTGAENHSIKLGMKLNSSLKPGNYENRLIVSVVSNPYTPKAVMTEGGDFYNKLESLLDNESVEIKYFRKSLTAPASIINTENIEDEESDYEIKLWLNPIDKTAYYYAEPEKVYLNADSSRMFFLWYGEQKIKNFLELDLSGFNTSNVTNMSQMFARMSNLTTLDLSSFDTSKVTNMSSMFENMYNLTTINLSSFDTSQVTDMHNMFFEISNLTTLDLSSFDTSQVTNMSSMFSGMRDLATLDLSSFDTSQVTNMSSMFSGMRDLATLDLSSFDTSQVTNMSQMFARMSNLTTLDLSSFDTSKVTNMGFMFYSMTNLVALDLSNFNTSKVTNMNDMFSLWYGDRLKDKLEKIYVNNDFDTTNLTDFSEMFENRKKLRGGNGSFLTNPSTADKSWLRIDDPAHGRPGYFTRKP